MGVWDVVLEVLSTAAFTVILAVMLVYILSVTSAFAHSDLRVVRETEPRRKREEEEAEGDGEGVGEASVEGRDGGSGEESKTKREQRKEDSPTARQSGDEGGSQDADDDDDEWEGVDASELEERFNAAAALVVTMAASSSSSSADTGAAGPHASGSKGGAVPAPMGEGLQLMLYSLYKQAMEGPCTAKQPSILNFKAKAKWDAWRSLGSMPSEEAMEKYVELVAKAHPAFAEGLLRDQDSDGGASRDERQSGSKAAGGGGGAGKSVSKLQYDDDDDGDGSSSEKQLSRLSQLAAEGQCSELEELLSHAASTIKEVDSEGRTALHWASDRGHVEAVEVLLRHGAPVDAQDSEGNTALHYAALCEHMGVARLLVKHGANLSIEDGEFITPRDLLPGELLESWLQR